MKLCITLLLCFTLGLSTHMHGQCLPAPAESCLEFVPLICDLNGYCGETPNSTSTQGTVNCGAFGIDLYGMQVVQFLATGSEVSLRIEFENCSGVVQPGGGVEYGMSGMLVATCPGNGTSALDCDQTLTQDGFLSLTIDDAIPGQFYGLAFTGWEGNACSYTITVISGADPLPPLIESGDEIEGPTQVCPGEITIYNAPEVENAESYLFALSSGQFQETIDPFIDIEWLEGLPDTTFTLCVSAFNQCEELIDYACLDIDYRNAIEFTIEALLCPGDVYSLGGNQYEAPGEYTYESSGDEGCDSLVFLILEVHDVPQVDNAVITNDDGSCNGSITLSVSGGSPPFSYEWSNGGSPSGLCAGFYGVTITDSNGCETDFEFEVELGTASLFLANAKAIPVSPNPVHLNQPMYIQHSGAGAIRSIAYINLQGQVLWQSTDIAVADDRVTLPGIAIPGLYRVKMLTDDDVLSIGSVLVIE